MTLPISEPEPIEEDSIEFLHSFERPVDEALAAWRASGQERHPELMVRVLEAHSLLIANVSMIFAGVFINFHELSDDELLNKAFIFARSMEVKYYVPKTWPEPSIYAVMASIQNDTAVVPGSDADVADVANALGDRLCALVMRANSFKIDNGDDDDDGAAYIRFNANVPM